MNSLLAAVLDLAGEDLVEERVKDDIPKVNCGSEKREDMRRSLKAVACVQIFVRLSVCFTCETDTACKTVEAPLTMTSQEMRNLSSVLTPTITYRSSSVQTIGWPNNTTHCTSFPI